MPEQPSFHSVALRIPGKRLRLFINVIIGACIVYLSGLLGFGILEMVGSDGGRWGAESGETAASPPVPEPVRSTAGEDLAKLHLFGQAGASGAEVTASVHAPVTSLELTLRGIFSGDNTDHSFAIIQDNRSKEERYFTLQQRVFGLATLEQIHEDRVVLLRNGRYEILVLPRDALSREHFYDSAAIQAEKKRIATNYRDRFLGGDGMDLIKLFGFEEAYKGGGFTGFRIRALGDEGRDMMETLGLEDGDLVTVINGLRFSEGLEAFEEIRKLKTAAAVDVMIDRNGHELPFHFEFETPDVVDNAGLASRSTAPPPVEVDAGDHSEPGYAIGLADSDSSLVEDDEELGMDWDETPEAEEFRARQREKSVGVGRPVEYDH